MFTSTSSRAGGIILRPAFILQYFCGLYKYSHITSSSSSEFLWGFNSLFDIIVHGSYRSVTTSVTTTAITTTTTAITTTTATTTAITTTPTITIPIRDRNLDIVD